MKDAPVMQGIAACKRGHITQPVGRHMKLLCPAGGETQGLHEEDVIPRWAHLKAEWMG